MKLSLNRLLVLLAALLMAAILAGCSLEGGKEEALPTAGYDTFKLTVDDVGPEQELDATGFPTGRRGFLFDKDLDGKGEYFYQLPKPTAGIVGLSFGDDGFANAGKPFAMARFFPGKTQYEIPLDSLTKWIRAESTVGYKKGQYVDQLNTLVWNDRVTDAEMEAPLTGKHKTFDYKIWNVSLVNLGDKSYSAGSDDSDDYQPEAFNQDDPHCADYKSICNAFQNTGYFNDKTLADGQKWSVGWCMQNMYWRNDGSAGTRYNSCIQDCADENSTDGIEGCVKNCQLTKLEDQYGCTGEVAPELDDAIYLVERGGTAYQAEKGITVTGSDKLSFLFDYKDAECDMNNRDKDGNFHLTQVVVNVNGGAAGSKTITLDPRVSLGCNSFEDKTMLGFTFGGLADGEYTFDVHLVEKTVSIEDASAVAGASADDRESVAANAKSLCLKEGTPYQGAFSVTAYEGNDTGKSAIGNISSDSYETFETGLNSFNLGKGFIDVRAASSKYLYNLAAFDIGIVQGYLWSVIGTDNFGDWTLDELNKAIFGTTQNTRATKFDNTDDIQSSAFYIDQPMSSGLFTFYGDAGWNLYPKAPYGNNTTQPFVRGAFSDTSIYIPFKPINAVNQYDGCTFDYSVWANFVFDQYPYGMGLDSFQGWTDKATFQEDLENFSGTGYGQCLINCLKRVQANINGCESVDECVDTCPSKPSSGASLCQLGFFKPLELKIKLTIPVAFLTSPEFQNLFTPDPENPEWKPLRIGLYAQGGNILPGGNVEYDFEHPERTDYTIQLPYFPYLPKEYLAIESTTSSGQAQIYVGIMDVNNQPYGISNNPPGGEHVEDWTYLVIWSDNWSSPEQEGWSLGTVEGNSITGFVDPNTAVIPVQFGILSPINQANLVP